jgi:hypothetical protein
MLPDTCGLLVRAGFCSDCSDCTDRDKRLPVSAVSAVGASPLGMQLRLLVAMGFGLALAVPAAASAAPPEYEQAYVGGETVTINAIEVHQSQGALTHAAADLYQVVYPTDHSLWPNDPQCNPCDHQGNGIDFTDFHDHVLDSVPGTGHGEFNPLWHVFLIVPNPDRPDLLTEYADALPLTSEAEVDALVASDAATEIDAHFYFLCSVVNGHAAH